MVALPTILSHSTQIQLVDRVGWVVVRVGHTTLDGVYRREPAGGGNILPRTHLDRGDGALVFGKFLVLTQPPIIRIARQGVGAGI